jgi:hypothetical protein
LVPWLSLAGAVDWNIYTCPFHADSVSSSVVAEFLKKHLSDNTQVTKVEGKRSLELTLEIKQHHFCIL